MRNHFLALLFMIFIPAAMLAQALPGRNDSINRFNAAHQKTGYWEEKMGDIISRGHYENDKKSGNWVTCLLSNNLLIKLEYYENGERNGIAIKLDRKGHLVSHEYFRNDLLEGESISYNSMSDLPSTQIEYAQGKKNGRYRLFYDNGKIQEETWFRDNQKNGTSKWFNKNGKMLAEYNYSNGVFNGVQKSWYENDTLQSVANYSNNVLNGDYREYYRNGIMKVQGKYSEGDKTGSWVEYDEMGKPVRTTKYKKETGK